jgi:hypothetical protein
LRLEKARSEAPRGPVIGRLAYNAIKQLGACQSRGRDMKGLATLGVFFAASAAFSTLAGGAHFRTRGRVGRGGERFEAGLECSMRALERTLGVLAAIGGPFYLVAVSFQSSSTLTCTSSICSTSSGSYWQREGLDIALNVVAAAVLGVAVAWLIWRHAESASGTLLAWIWAVCALLVLATIFLAFSYIGAATFFMAPFTFLAALVGIVVQVRDRAGQALDRSLPPA